MVYGRWNHVIINRQPSTINHQPFTIIPSTILIFISWRHVVCICGAGTMGRGIALAVASHGMQTILYDLNPEMISDRGEVY